MCRRSSRPVGTLRKGLIMFEALLVSTGAIFVAELGDKSQLMALAFASRYRARDVLIGITLATAAVHAFSTLLGALLTVRLPTDAISVVAGVAFLGFAAWTLRGDRLDASEVERHDGRWRSAIAAACIAFFLAELGDKTMLATITLGTTYEPWGTWIGSTVGMVLADGLAILLGSKLQSRVSDRAIRLAAATSFVVFGAILVVQGLQA